MHPKFPGLKSTAPDPQAIYFLRSRSRPRSLRWRAQHWLQPPPGVSAALGEALLWMAMAIALRLALEGLLALSPLFWIPAVLVLALPALLAMVLATWQPSLSVLLGYRLGLVMVGLLIGGRL